MNEEIPEHKIWKSVLTYLKKIGYTRLDVTIKTRDSDLEIIEITPQTKSFTPKQRVEISSTFPNAKIN